MFHIYNLMLNSNTWKAEFGKSVMYKASGQLFKWRDQNFLYILLLLWGGQGSVAVCLYLFATCVCFGRLSQMGRFSKYFHSAGASWLTWISIMVLSEPNNVLFIYFAKSGKKSFLIWVPCGAFLVFSMFHLQTLLYFTAHRRFSHTQGLTLDKYRNILISAISYKTVDLCLQAYSMKLFSVVVVF